MSVAVIANTMIDINPGTFQSTY